MKITVIYGTMRKSTTYNLAKKALQQFPDAEVKEFFLPKDMPHFCVGCGNCYVKGEEFCPHHDSIGKIIAALDEADLMIFTSPVYSMHVTAQLKTVLDHLGWRFLIHRPEPSMFSKAALVICTAAGGGLSSTFKDIADSLKWWGVARTYRYTKAVRALSWATVPEHIKNKTLTDIEKLAQKIEKQYIKGFTPTVSTKILFNFIRIFHKKGIFSEIDHIYWEKQGWLGSHRPWHKNKTDYQA
ncbi:MAG: flavodoxin family protein [Brevinema sp.]